MEIINNRGKQRNLFRNFLLNWRVFFIFIFLSALIPLIALGVGTYTLLHGNEFLGTTFSTHPSFMEILPNLLKRTFPNILGWTLVVLIGCYSLGMLGGGCFFFPFFSGLLIISVLWLVSATIAHVLKLFFSKTLNIIIATSSLCIICLYLLLFFGNYLAKTDDKNALEARYSIFEEKYGFSGYTPPGHFISIQMINNKESGTDRRQIWLSDFYGNQKTVLLDQNIASTGSRKLIFPSPKGSYFISSQSSGLKVTSTVVDKNSTEIFNIPTEFKTYQVGSVLWSPSERYLAIHTEAASTTKFGLIDYRFFIYDILKKKEILKHGSVGYHDFAWGPDDMAYYSCGSHICSFIPSNSERSKIYLETVACNALAISKDNRLYCSLSSAELEKATGKNVTITNDQKRDPKLAGFDFFIISQDLSVTTKNDADSILKVISLIPIQEPRMLILSDNQHLISYSPGNRKIQGVDLLSGRVTSFTNNVFDSSMGLDINNGSLPVIYRR